MNTIDYEAALAEQPRFFLGANAGSGFYNGFAAVYDPLQGEHLFILKGGPGTGKSTFMKRTAAAVLQQGEPCELCYCSSDPRSLDGVRFPTLGAAIVDGTAPHVTEAKYLGVSERIVNVGDCLDMAAVEAERETLLPLYEQNAKLHKRAGRFIAAASQLLDDSFTADCEGCQMEKAEELARRLCRTLLPVQKSQGRQAKRFLSAVTPEGGVVFEDTVYNLAEQIIVIDDEFGAAASVMLAVVRQWALDAGYESYVCPCAVSPERKIDHVIVPGRRLAFCTANSLLAFDREPTRRIRAGRFRDNTVFAQHKQRMRFNKRAAAELLEGAHNYLAQARQVHDQIEAFYVAAMDFDRLEDMRRQTTERILSRTL